nr:zinc finger, CCHC-type [Tanacetum cinerariifolium]
MAWYRKRNKALTIFKVDFEKTLDSLRWDYLDVIIEKLGFGLKWSMWIFGCLKNSRASILVNGSPTSEFEMLKGLRQRDPMSLFLFILAMEGLHAMVSKAENTGLFKGWSHTNAYNLICLLRCFFMVSGVKINMHKSNILSVNVHDEEVSNMAFVLGRRVAKLPMMYLGWKAKLLSVGGRLSLIKAVLGNLPTYYMSLYWMPITVQKRLESMRNRFFIGGDFDDKKITWVKWKSCLASKAMGGLGIGSIFALNVALLFKWVWRFRTSSNVLWVNVIKDIHGHDGGIRNGRTWKSSYSPWSSILRSVSQLQARGIDLFALCGRFIGDGSSISFLDDSCVLKRPPRGGAKSNQYDELILAIRYVVLSDSVDGWIHLDFQLRLDKLPTLVNLDKKGIDVDSLLCPVCNAHVETVNHLFFSCEMEQDLWGLLARWCALDILEVSNVVEWFSWLDTAHVSKSARITLEGIVSIMMWDGEVAGNIHQRVDGLSFVNHRVSKLKNTIRWYSIIGSILSGISLQRGGFQEMVEEDALYAFQHECGVCADYSHARGWGMLILPKSYVIPWKPNIWLRMPQVSCIIDKLSPSWKDFKHTLKHLKEELTLVELGSYLRIEESLRAQDNDTPKGNNVAGPSVVNMVEHNNSSNYNDQKGKRKHHDTRANANKKPKVTCWKCEKPGHLKKDFKGGNVGNRANRSSTKGSEDGSSNPLKGQSMFNKSLQIYYVTYVSESFFVQDDDVAWWVDSGATVNVCKDRCWFKTYESLNDGSILHMGNESTALVHRRGYVDLRFSFGNVVSLLNVLHVPNIRKNLVLNIILNNCGYKQVIESNKFVLSKLGHVYFKRMQDMSKDGLISAIDMDTEKCKTCMLTKITNKPFQNIKPETKVLELIHSDLCDLHATPSLGNKKYFVTFIDDASRFCYVYLLHSNDEALNKFKVFKTEVELQQESLIKRFRTDMGGEYMDTLYFQSVSIIHEMIAPYAPQQNGISARKNKVLKEMVNSMLSCSRLSQGFWGEAMFYVIEPNDSVAINSIIGLRDVIFDEHMFSLVPRPSQRSLDVAFWKEAINDKIDSIMGNNTWVLTDLPPGCRPLGCKWIFKRKLKVYGTVEKFKARLVIQGFNQKSGIYYFDTYAPVARISTIRLLTVMAFIHNLIIHQMDMKTTFLNGDLEEEVYMNQPLGFIMPGNKNKMCKLIKSLHGLKQTSKQWHQKFDEVVLSNGYLLNQANKCVYSKFDASSKGVIIFLYVDDMLIFDTDQVQMDLTKEFLSSRFFMKDMREAYVILGIRIKHESNGISISQCHYIEKVLKKFNYYDCTPVSTPLDTCEKLMPNRGFAVSQLEYSRVIGCLMYAMTCTRPNILFVVGKLSRYTSNPGTQHWQAIQRVLKYLKKTMDYRLVYSGYPSMLKGYTDASWISNTEDNSSTSSWVFLLGGGEISWAFKKQTCITGSIMESEFVALAAVGKEAKCAATLAKAYSQMYNGKSRHLGVRHSMIRELIMNRVVSIEFVRSQQNLVDHLTKEGISSEEVSSAKYLYNGLFQIEPSARMLHSGLADDSGL